MSKKLFSNPKLEALSKTNAPVAISLYYLIAVTIVAIGIYITGYSGLHVVKWFFSGWLFFSFLEYCTHRWLFHLVSSDPAKQRFQYIIHGVHHADPRDAERQVLPFLVSIPMAGLLLGVSYLMLGFDGFFFFPGLFTGYATYLIVHYSVHIFRPPKNKINFFWRYHAIHHYAEDKYAFGVSSPLWDVVFGTYPYKQMKRKPGGVVASKISNNADVR